MILFYQFLLFCVILIFLPFILIYIYFKKGAVCGLSERLTLYSSLLKKEFKSKKYQLWIHAASVGEVKLLKKIPGLSEKNTIITCTTISGKKIAGELFSDITAVLAPVDFLFFMKRFKKFVKPPKVLIVETELWPGLIYSIKNLKVLLINARLSKKKFPMYYLFRKYLRKLFSWIDIVYVKDKENYLRFKRLGVSEEKLKILGDLKYYFEIPDINTDILKKPEHPVIVCGSTHKDEERILLEIFRDLKIEFENLSLIISPRHLNRLEEIKELLTKNDIKYTLWSEKHKRVECGEVVLVDKIGELTKIYSLSTIAYVGGTMVKVGGHNIIEPASWGVPVITGPHFENFNSVVRLFKINGGLKVAEDSEDLYNILKRLLIYSDLRKEMGEKNKTLATLKKKEITEKLKQIL